VLSTVDHELLGAVCSTNKMIKTDPMFGNSMGTPDNDNNNGKISKQSEVKAADCAKDTAPSRLESGVSVKHGSKLTFYVATYGTWPDDELRGMNFRSLKSLNKHCPYVPLFRDARQAAH